MKLKDLGLILFQVVCLQGTLGWCIVPEHVKEVTEIVDTRLSSKRGNDKIMFCSVREEV